MAKTTSMVAKAQALNKAGLSPWVTIVIVVLSTPGLWTFFISDKAEVADAKAEVGYELLKASVENLRDDNKAILEELRDQEKMIFQIALQRGVSLEVPESDSEGLASTGTQRATRTSRRRGGSATAAASGVLVGAVEEAAEEPSVEATPAPAQQALPDNLDKQAKIWIEKKR